MHDLPSLAEMRAQQDKIASYGPGSRIFGLLWCQECGCQRAFTSHDAHVQHITDAACDACGFVYGRRDTPEVRRGVVGPDGKVIDLHVPPKRRQPVIDDATALAAERAWQAQLTPNRRPASPPRPAMILPDDRDDDSGSRVSSYKRSLR